MDRPHLGPAGPARAGGTLMTANLPETAKIIEARNLEKSFGETPALRGASLSIRPGEIVAVMGPSGSGKSTLLHCLAGILVPGQGEVWFGGQRLDTLSDDRRSALRRNRFGFVFQSGQLVPELTAEENVALPLLLSGTRRGPAMTAARKWFGTLGLDGLEQRRSGSWTCSPPPPASRAPPSSWSPTTPGSPPTPTGRSSSATARSARSPGPSRDRARAAAGDQRRPGGRRPVPRPDRRRGPGRRLAADRRGRDQRGHHLEQQPRMALDCHQIRAPGSGYGRHRPAVVAPQQRHLRRPEHLPLRRGRHRCFVPGAAGHPP